MIGLDLVRCEGCSLNQIEEQEGCRKWSDITEVQELITRFIKRKDRHTLELNKEMLNIQKERCSGLQKNEEHQFKKIVW